MLIQITSNNSSGILAHYRNVCGCHIYWEEYAVNFVISMCVLYKKQKSYINIVAVNYPAASPRHLLSALLRYTHSPICCLQI